MAAPLMVLHGSAVGGVKVIQPGQVLTFSFTETNTTKVTASAGTAASARVCVQSEATGKLGPCLTVPVKIA